MLFLPVLTAGPIFRYRDFLKTFDNPIALNAEEAVNDVKRIIRGMFKKVVLVELLSYAATVLLAGEVGWFQSFVIVVISYMLLYFDLSGYSDMAIALGRLAGYEIPENFKKPLRAPTFTQFWRSWHATLSDWIREHIYIVVAKKKLGKPASASIAFATMIVMSLWHGFNVPFLLAGVYNGILLAAENLLSLTTVNIRKTRRSVFYLRCFAVNFLFALNTLVFSIPADKLTVVLRGFLNWS
jgi:alginate O-acetyltransferase complex protein AlgI